MSADMWLSYKSAEGSDYKDAEAWDGNITYNLSPMWYDAGWDFHTVGGKKAKELQEQVTSVLEKLKANPDKYRAMNPANGWGDYDGCVEFFEGLLIAIRAHPESVAGTGL